MMNLVTFSLSRIYLRDLVSSVEVLGQNFNFLLMGASAKAGADR